MARSKMAKTRTSLHADQQRGLDPPEMSLGVKQRQSLKLPSAPVTPDTPLKRKRIKGSLPAALSTTPQAGTTSETPSLMSHAERQRLIQRPFQSQFRVLSPKSHGGTTLGDSGSVPTEGHRTWQVSPADESYLRYGKFEGEEN